MNTRGLAVLVLLAGWGSSNTAHATWSTAAADPQTGEVGVSVASCVEAPFGTTILPQVAGVVPDVGALAAQAAFSQQTRDQAVALLAAGNAPQAVIDMVVAGDFQSASRQYGVVTLDGQAAGFTGAANMSYAGDVQSVGVSVQGNILYGSDVVDDALAAFEAEPPMCPWTLADRLMAALEAGAAHGGDSRCSEEQSALAAVLIVARPGDAMEAPTLDLRIPSQPPGGDSPVALLRDQYDEWRASNPPDDSGCSAGTGTSSGGTTTGGVEATTSTSTSAATSASSSTAASTSQTAGASAATTDGGTQASTTASQDARDEGCNCRTEAGRRLSAAWLIVLLGAVRLGARRRPEHRRFVSGRGAPPGAKTRPP